MYQESGNKYDRLSLDHIIPLSRGGTWDLENLQVISWFDNRAKCDMTQDEYEAMKKKYWH
ncbi:MAG: HNH endonuclease [Selenomonadaceae bacterium]|nr:HNH endonuclease [Selenomonadaceae bacterium]